LLKKFVVLFPRGIAGAGEIAACIVKIGARKAPRIGADLDLSERIIDKGVALPQTVVSSQQQTLFAVFACIVSFAVDLSSYLNSTRNFPQAPPAPESMLAATAIQQGGLFFQQN
jgi:hypothetical protein